jgi:hypothetical protein
MGDTVKAESFSVKSLGPSLNRAGRKRWSEIEKEAAGGPNYVPSLSFPVRGEREFLALVSEDKPVAFAATTVDKNWIEKRKENVGFIDDFIILPTYREGAAVLIDHCLSHLRDKGVDQVLARSRGFPFLKAGEFEVLPPFLMPNNPPWHVDLFCESGFALGKEYAMLYIPTLPSKSALPPQIEPEAQEFLHRINAEFRRINMGNWGEVKRYSDLVDEIFTPHFGYNPGGLTEWGNSLGKRILMQAASPLLRIRMYVGLVNGVMVAHFWFFPDIAAATQGLKRGGWGGLLNPINWINLIRFARSVRRRKRVHLQSIGFKQDIRRGWGYAITMLDYGIKLIVDEGYEEAILGPILVENLSSIKFATRRLVPKILEREGYGTEERESIVENLWHTLYSQKEASKAPEIGGGLKIMRYCTLVYQF